MNQNKTVISDFYQELSAPH